VLALAACSADEPPADNAEVGAPPGAVPVAAPVPDVEPTSPAKVAPRELVVGRVAELGVHTDLSQLVVLDLALSVEDAAERGDLPPPSAAGQAERCAGLDLVALAGRAPRLETLRIAGCPQAVHAGLAAFAPTLRELELVDLVLDGVTVGRITQLGRLEALTLTRVHPGPEPPAGLGASVKLRSLTLRDLAPDSPVGDLLGDFPTLERARLEGAWAGHRAMLSLAKARRLVHLELVDTSVGNFALNQLKPLHELRSVDWTGSTFNDMSPLYLRELPITSFRCACARLGDVGLRHLRYLEQLQVLDLPRSEVSGAGLSALAELANLEEIRLLHRDVEGGGLAALATLPALRRLTLGKAELSDPRAEHLGELTRLEELTFTFSNFDDRGAAQLEGLRGLRRLDLGDTAISDLGLRHLVGLHALVSLKLHHTRVTNRGLAHLAGLRALEVLELDHTDVVDEGVAHLAGLSGLRELRLDHTLITDRALASIVGLPRLERLNLAGTVITREGARLLEGHPTLSVVDLSDTRAGGQ
jgi:hypothetical protein